MVTTEDMLQVATTFNCHPGANIGFLFSFYHKRFWNTSSGAAKTFHLDYIARYSKRKGTIILLYILEDSPSAKFG